MPARRLLLALQSLTPAPAPCRFVSASVDPQSSAGVFLQLLFITTLPLPRPSPTDTPPSAQTEFPSLSCFRQSPKPRRGLEAPIAINRTHKEPSWHLQILPEADRVFLSKFQGSFTPCAVLSIHSLRHQLHPFFFILNHPPKYLLPASKLHFAHPNKHCLSVFFCKTSSHKIFLISLITFSARLRSHPELWVSFPVPCITNQTLFPIFTGNAHSCCILGFHLSPASQHPAPTHNLPMIHQHS